MAREYFNKSGSFAYILARLLLLLLRGVNVMRLMFWRDVNGGMVIWSLSDEFYDFALRISVLTGVVSRFCFVGSC